MQPPVISIYMDWVKTGLVFISIAFLYGPAVILELN